MDIFPILGLFDLLLFCFIWVRNFVQSTRLDWLDLAPKDSCSAKWVDMCFRATQLCMSRWEQQAMQGAPSRPDGCSQRVCNTLLLRWRRRASIIVLSRAFSCRSLSFSCNFLWLLCRWRNLLSFSVSLSHTRARARVHIAHTQTYTRFRILVIGRRCLTKQGNSLESWFCSFSSIPLLEKSRQLCRLIPC